MQWSNDTPAMLPIDPEHPDSEHAPVPRPSLAALAYEQLRRLARFRMHRERAGHTLTPTALVHEAVLRLGDGKGRTGRDLLLAAGEAMQRILVEHARRRNSIKRGGGKVQSQAGDELDRLPLGLDDRAAAAAELREHLAALEQAHPEAHEVVMLRHYAGMGVEEVAVVLGVDRRTVSRRWMVARAWLFERMTRGDERRCMTRTTNPSPP